MSPKLAVPLIVGGAVFDGGRRPVTPGTPVALVPLVGPLLLPGADVEVLPGAVGRAGDRAGGSVAVAATPVGVSDWCVVPSTAAEIAQLRDLAPALQDAGSASTWLCCEYQPTQRSAF